MIFSRTWEQAIEKRGEARAEKRVLRGARQMLQLVEAQLGPLSPEHQKRLDASALDRWAQRLAAKVTSLDELFG